MVDSLAEKILFVENAAQLLEDDKKSLVRQTLFIEAECFEEVFAAERGKRG